MKRGDLRDLLIAAGVGVVGIAIIAPVVGSHASSSARITAGESVPDTSESTVSATVPSSVPATPVTDPTDTTQTEGSTAATAATDVTGSTSVDAGQGCTITDNKLRRGSTGPSVICLQTALALAGYYTGPPSGTYDSATVAAVRKLQTAQDLFLDGIAGRETGLALGIWPDETSLVVHTPPPAAGAVDLMGYPLSSVATSGPDAPPVPANSGSGRRLVYQRAGQRVWAIDENNQVIRSWLVSGSMYENEKAGTWKVFSRSELTTAWNGHAYLHNMVRYLESKNGNIGFHSIPEHVADGTAYQTEAQLGQRLSDGCQRQAALDAAFTWDFAQIGTPVIVL